jgi:hypothetical protein
MRLSLLAFYYRLVNDAGKEKFRLALHISVVFITTLFVVSTFLGIFVCLYVSQYPKMSTGLHQELTSCQTCPILLAVSYYSQPKVFRRGTRWLCGCYNQLHGGFGDHLPPNSIGLEVEYAASGSSRRADTLLSRLYRAHCVSSADILLLHFEHSEL